MGVYGVNIKDTLSWQQQPPRRDSQLKKGTYLRWPFEHNGTPMLQVNLRSTMEMDKLQPIQEEQKWRISEVKARGKEKKEEF